LFNRIWCGDKCHTLKSCAGVILIGTAVAAFLLIIRLVGENRLQYLLNVLLSFSGKERRADLVSERLAPENQV
jgi:hypothetical protein